MPKKGHTEEEGRTKAVSESCYMETSSVRYWWWDWQPSNQEVKMYLQFTFKREIPSEEQTTCCTKNCSQKRDIVLGIQS
jgi:hypothetical protein